MKILVQRLLTVNSGSSSIKFAVYTADAALTKIWVGGIFRIGFPNSLFQVKCQKPKVIGQPAMEKETATATENAGFARTQAIPDHSAAIAILMDWMVEVGLESGLAAIGHRIVLGGPNYSIPQKINQEMLDELRRLSPFDPEHLPQEIQIIEAFQSRWKHLPQVACFDTAFHHDLPRIAQMLPIPRRYGLKGIRRYGFHGLSYAFLMEELSRIAGTEAAQGRIILAHLGNGASLAAVHDGKPVDTSMGFTPASGLVMGSRSGDLDPGVFSYLSREEGMTVAGFLKMVNHESGLLGISESSSDMQDLLAAESKDIRAAEAVDLFCYQTRKWIGSFAAALGGLDSVVFSGGIGEHSPAVRSRICAGLDFLGIQIDGTKNQANAKVISTDSGKVLVRVIPTDEELMIARLVLRVLGS